MASDQASEKPRRRRRSEKADGAGGETRGRPARTLVLVPVLPPARRDGEGPGNGQPRPGHAPEDRRQEAVGLAQAIGLDVRASRVVNVGSPRPATLIGKGKLEEVKELVTHHEAELVIIDHALSPVQQRNLEKAWSCKVLDRTGIILEIFGARARTREGRLQVELAHLTYQKSRLVRSWTHLERQRGARGGAGFLGGPGETQLEIDRRLIQERIDAIGKELAGVVRTRELHREGRRKVPYPTVAIVGYTNAGKSTLFNRLTGAAVLAMDQVFATLDPTLREIRLPSGRRVILSDTVGFISDLPTMLVAAFRATLEEVVEADLILHLRDISHAESAAQKADVEDVLGDLGRDPASSDTPILEVWNKIDLMPAEQRRETVDGASRQDMRTVALSAKTGEGIDRLLAAIDAHFATQDEELTLIIPAGEGALMSWLYQNAQVVERAAGEQGEMVCRIRIEQAKKGRLLSRLSRSGAVVS